MTKASSSAWPRMTGRGPLSCALSLRCSFLSAVLWCWFRKKDCHSFLWFWKVHRLAKKHKKFEKKSQIWKNLINLILFTNLEKVCKNKKSSSIRKISRIWETSSLILKKETSSLDLKNENGKCSLDLKKDLIWQKVPVFEKEFKKSK